MSKLLDRAKSTWPGLSQTDLKIALWSLTTYPTGDPDEVLAVLKDAYNKSDGNLLSALEQADAAIVAQQTLTTAKPG